MSLTNPTAVVTEERLNEYHNIILPFLGGMPDILANKFSRADLYSTDEKMVGRWTDGKPLYQKTISLPIARTIATGAWYDIYTNSEVNAISKLVSAFIQTPDGYIFEGQNYRANGADLQMFSSMSLTIPVNSYVTIQYTKTTDSPIEIGNDTDYSTTEKIIGTWIDGKPIYQKVYTGLSYAVTANTWSNSGIDATGVKQVIKYYGYNSAGERYEFAITGIDVTSVCFTGKGNASGITLATLVIQYTKTTD